MAMRLCFNISPVAVSHVAHYFVIACFNFSCCSYVSACSLSAITYYTIALDVVFYGIMLVDAFLFCYVSLTFCFAQ